MQHACRLKGAEHGMPAANGIFHARLDRQSDPQALKTQAALAVYMGDSTTCCTCATANCVLIVQPF